MSDSIPNAPGPEPSDDRARNDALARRAVRRVRCSLLASADPVDVVAVRRVAERIVACSVVGRLGAGGLRDAVAHGVSSCSGR